MNGHFSNALLLSNDGENIIHDKKKIKMSNFFFKHCQIGHCSILRFLTHMKQLCIKETQSTEYNL